MARRRRIKSINELSPQAEAMTEHLISMLNDKPLERALRTALLQQFLESCDSNGVSTSCHICGKPIEWTQARYLEAAGECCGHKRILTMR